MAIRSRNGIWHYRFEFDGREVSGTTHLAATERNRTSALQREAEHRQALRDGRLGIRRLEVRQMSDGVQDFLKWAEAEYRAHPSTHRRLKVSFSSLSSFFGKDVVSLIDGGRIEAFKTWRIQEHHVRDVTLRHDLDALSKFFGFALKNNWCRENPVRHVTIPSDAEAHRIHSVSEQEAKIYFRHAARNRDLYDLTRIILDQGMRPEEVLSLAKTDVDLERDQVNIRLGKSKAARRTLDLTSETRTILASRMASPGQWIFPSLQIKGKPVKRLNYAHGAGRD